jgi:hypothetical protein
MNSILRHNPSSPGYATDDWRWVYGRKKTTKGFLCGSDLRGVLGLRSDEPVDEIVLSTTRNGGQPVTVMESGGTLSYARGIHWNGSPVRGAMMWGNLSILNRLHSEGRAPYITTPTGCKLYHFWLKAR